MPRVPGILVLPNSAPDSFTPKYVNLVRVPEQLTACAAELVDEAVVNAAVEVAARMPDAAALGWHWE